VDGMQIVKESKLIEFDRNERRIVSELSPRS